MPPTRKAHRRPPGKRAEHCSGRVQKAADPGPIRLDIIIAAAVFVIAMRYTIRATIFPSSTVTAAVPTVGH
jgi:hypothetical protein